jgi:hypothetical protein
MLWLDFTVAVGTVAGSTILAAWSPTRTTDAVSVEVSRDPAVRRGSKGIPFPTRGKTQWYSRYICTFVFDERKAIKKSFGIVSLMMSVTNKYNVHGLRNV